MDFTELEANLQLFDDWSERYQYIISLGRKLPELEADFHTETYRIEGCLSQVWLRSRIVDGGGAKTLEFDGDSDSSIVKGLFAILHILYSGKSASEILAVNIEDAFGRLGLEQHLSPNRRNGFFAMTEEIRRAAVVLQSTSAS